MQRDGIIATNLMESISKNKNKIDKDGGIEPPILPHWKNQRLYA